MLDDTPGNVVRERTAEPYDGERATPMRSRLGDDGIRRASERAGGVEGGAQAAWGNAMDSPGSRIRTDSAR